MRTANRVVGVVVGALFLLLGVVGLVASAGTGLFGPGVSLGGVVATNPALGLIQAVLGAAVLLGAVSSLVASRTVNAWSGFAFLVLGIAGLFLVGPEPNVLALTATANAVHFGASVMLLAVGLGANRP
ncbi:MAG TPA: DUF4383 domain-containing protein [Rhodoglobus sp.]|nr:DUF4383 domain-containing protein [Rhodoglobus sp.]HPG76720.1 DUF4383 domain-containing protein [Rhodoglobus sp.]HPM51645.1 DUF4383 domain-containing protein [Rhodoglobus sp.]